VRILFIEPFGHREGHFSVESKRVVDALAEAGVSITLLTFDGVRGNWAKTSKIDRHISVVPRHGYFRRWLRLISRLRRFLPTRLVADALETFLTLLWALRECQQRKYEAIHFFDGNPAFVLPFVAAFTTKNYSYVVNIYTPASLWVVEGGYQRFKSSLRQKDYQYCLFLLRHWLPNTRGIALIQRLTYQRALRKNRFSFICHTNEIKESYQLYSVGGILYERMHVIPLGRKQVEQQVIPQREARQYLRLPEKAKIFLSFGQIHYGKNCHVIFQAIQDMPKDFYLLFAGKLEPGDDIRDPVKLARKYDWVKNTIIVDKFVPEEEKPYYFFASDAIILSYTPGFTRSASLINEACQFQLPVIASEVGQLGEYVRDYNLGIRFTPEDSQSLRQAIISFLSLKEEERQAIKANFSKFAADLPWEEVANRYKALYL